MSNANTLYAALGLEPSASAEEIEAAYREREQALQGQTDARSLLRVAYDTLRNPEQRAAYDRKIARQNSAPPPRLYELDTPHVRRGPSRVLNWLILLLAAGGTAGYFWIKTPQPAPKKTSGTITTTYVDLPPAPSAAAPAQAVQAAPAATEPGIQAGDQSPSGAVDVHIPNLPAAPAVKPSRRAKQPGFDSQYVAWSVFLVLQRNRSGSGVMIGPDRILTNCHVLAGGATNGLVVVHSMTKEVFKVEKYARLDGEDACLLLAPGAGSNGVAWGSSATLRPGDTLHTMGHPGGSSDIVWSEGAFETRVTRGGETFLMSNNFCRPGSSGGPLLDHEGRLVGVVTAVQRFKAKAGGDALFGNCISVTEETARALLAKPLFPIALAPAQYIPNY